MSRLEMLAANFSPHHAAPHSTLFMDECGVEREQQIVSSPNESSVIVLVVSCRLQCQEYVRDRRAKVEAERLKKVRNRFNSDERTPLQSRIWVIPNRIDKVLDFLNESPNDLRINRELFMLLSDFLKHSPLFKWKAFCSPK